jgi:D-aminoacyl-tRNA deacylase
MAARESRVFAVQQKSGGQSSREEAVISVRDVSRRLGAAAPFGALQRRGPERSMRAVIQRVRHAQVSVDGRVVGEIGAGIVVLLGIAKGDANEAAQYLAEKTANMRIFDDANQKMNASLLESRGAALVVSQFTLYADLSRGRRPGFERAAPPAEANRIYQEFVAQLKSLGVPVETGVFQAHMVVELENDGPVTILLDSDKAF